MAHTKVTKNGTQNTGAANTFSYSGSFDVFKASEVEVELDNVALTFTTSTINESASPREYTVDYNNKTVHVGGANLASSNSVVIQPVTDMGAPTPRATYAPGSSVTSEDLNNNQLQLMRKAMEYDEQKLSSRGGTMTGNLHFGKDVDLSFEGDTDNTYETTLTVADPTADRTITFPDTTGTVVTTGDTGTVTGTMLANGTVTSTDIEDGTIVNSDINASAGIAGTKVSPDFGSQNISTTGTINNLTTTELAILDDATVTTSELNILDGVTATTTEINTLDGVTATTAEINKLDGVTADTAELNILDGVTATTAELNYVDGVTSNVQTQLDGKQSLDSELTELATMGSGTASALADLSQAEVETLDGITASTSELNLLDGKSIVTTIAGNATDVQIPSAQAVNERVVELVTEVGGFVPIANETSFPATNPDVNDGAGTIVSIKALASNLVANGSGVATIANGAGTGNTVTINGLSAGSTTAAGLGILVETTTTLHTYTFHRVVVDAAGVSNAQTLVSDFNDRYQISGSQPSAHPDGSSLQDGDLWFDTNANIMKVYDLGNTQYDAVTSVGDFKLLTVVPDGATSGSPTFDGNIVSYDLRDGSNAANVTNVGQLLVSLNGVIQKPNSGSYNASNEGFYLEGANGIKFCTAPPSGSSLFVTLIGAATSIGTPSDNTVSSAKLTSDSVIAGKIASGTIVNDDVNASAAIAGTKVSPDFGSQNIVTTGTLGAGAFTTTGDISITNTGPKITFTDSDNNPDYFIQDDNGAFRIRDVTNSADRLQINSDGHIDLNGNVDISSGLDVTGNITCTGTIPAAQLTGTLPAIDGSNLTGLQAGATGGNSGGNAVFWENEATVTHDYTISNNKNAGSFGPITINNGVTVTVGSGETWTIV